MALLNPTWNYWYLTFWAQVFAPFGVDVLFTVGLIIVSDSFPEKTQALAGAVFNTAAQFGTTFGMGCCQVEEEEESSVLLEGYQASFWTMFAYSIVCVFIAVGGLRKVGKVGLKRD
jgi:MFS family permease